MSLLGILHTLRPLTFPNLYFAPLLECLDETPTMEGKEKSKVGDEDGTKGTNDEGICSCNFIMSLGNMMNFFFTVH